MKALFLVMAIGLAGAASATGNFYCASKDEQTRIVGLTGHTVGSPLIGPIFVKAGSNQFSFGPKLVVQYKSNPKSLYLLAVNERASYATVELDTYLQTQGVLAGQLAGRLSLQFEGPDGKIQKVNQAVTCEVE